MLQEHKSQLRSLVNTLRHTLDCSWNEAGEPIRGDLDRELERIGFGVVGTITPLDALPKRTQRDERAYRVVEAQLATLPKDERPAVRAEIVERTAYTWINRLLALRTMEARGLIEETLRTNPAYEGVSEALYMLRYERPEQTRGPDAGWWAVIENASETQSRLLPGLFDVKDPNVALRPSTSALLTVIQAVGDPELDDVFADPDAISWAYQFYQEEAKSRIYAKLGGGGKVETRSEIAAATQLFTEPYMVKWLLQNSLGRTYVDAYPDTKLPDNWEYYIDREKVLAEHAAREAAERGDDNDVVDSTDAEPEPRRIFKLNELTFLDPCCGSGHFLREAFDMLYAMYREQEPDMAERSAILVILQKHLHGIDIDPRAAQLSAITLVLRAWETAGGGPFELPALNIATTPSLLDAGALDRHLQRHPEDQVYKPILTGVFTVLEQAPILGSLLKPEEHLDAAIQEFRKGKGKQQPAMLSDDESANRLLGELAQHDPDELKMLLLQRIAASFANEVRDSDISAQIFGREAGEGLHLLQLLDRKYAVVATNPPYMGSKNMDAPLRKYVEKYYKPGKRDLYAAFILRCLELAHLAGRIAMVTQQSWMFLKSFADLRAVPDDALAKARSNGEFTGLLREIEIEGLAHLGPNAFEEISGEVVQSALFTLAKRVPEIYHKMVAYRLTGQPSSTKAYKLRCASSRSSAKIRSLANQYSLLSLPDTPLAYWFSDDLLRLFSDYPPLYEYIRVSEGVQTSDDLRFVRYHWEAPLITSGWTQYAKGGGFSKWAGLELYCLDWRNDGASVSQFLVERYPYLNGNLGMLIRDPELFGTTACTYTDVAGGCLSVRESIDAIGSAPGPIIVSIESWRQYSMLAYLNSRLHSYLLRGITPNPLHFRKGYLYSLPGPIETILVTLRRLGELATELKRFIIHSRILENRYCLDGNRRRNDDLTAPAWLATIEGVIETVVFEALSVSETSISSVVEETGTPAGLYPLIVGYDIVLEFPILPESPIMPDELSGLLTAHSRVDLDPNEYAGVKANLKTLFEAGPGVKTDDLDLKDLDHQEDNDEDASGAYIPIPTETFLEELSHHLQIHPISVYWLLEELRAEGVRCKPEEKRLLEDRLTVIILRLLGHRWPKQIEAGEPVPEWADQDGVIPLTSATGEVTLADRIRLRLRSEDGDLGAQETEAILQELTNRTLEEWLQKDFFKRHTSQFKKRPIAWHLASDPTAGGRKKSATPAFECMVYYHATDSDVLARIRRQYVDNLLAPAQRELAHARQQGDETAAAQAVSLIQELDDFAERLRQVEEFGFSCVELDKYIVAETLDRWSGDGINAPRTQDELLQHERAWTVDINDGVRVNIAPVQQAGLLTRDVLSKKDVPKAIADRARWRSDERRWVREGKLPRCGWMDESVPESPKWTELAPEREGKRQRLEEKRKMVLAELKG